MAENTAVVQPGAAAGAAGAGSPSPAANTSAPSPAAGGGDAGRLSGLSDDQERGALDAFDGPGAVPLDGPTKSKPAADPAAGKPGKEPSDDLATTGADGKPAGEAKKDGQAKPDPLPFDDELGALTPLDAGKPDALAELADVSSPEAFAKAVNPDGKASEADQLKNAQALIGKQSQVVSQAKQLTAQIAPFVLRDDQGQPVGLDVLAIGDALGIDAVNAALASRNQKIVPADWGPEQMAVEREFPADLVNKLVPGDDMTFDEKVELIKGDAGKLVDIRVAKREREMQAQHQEAQAHEAQQAQTATRLTQLAQADKNFGKLKAAMSQWNHQLPDEIGGALRADLCYRLAKLDYLLSPQVRKAQSDAIFKRAEAEFIKNHNLSSPVGGGGVVRSPGGGGAGEEFAAVKGATESFG